jgi:DNA-binding MarR family transcriptional regulator
MEYIRNQKEHVDRMTKIINYEPKGKEVWEDLRNNGRILFFNICNRYR